MKNHATGSSHEINHLQQLEQLSGQLLNRRRAVFHLAGALGTGKSTFVRLALARLGFSGPVPSPSYSLINSYEFNGLTVIHSDLYRLTEPEELLYLDLWELAAAADFVFIEWPEKGGDLLPPPDVYCEFTLTGGQRRLWVSPALEN